jgi:N-formylglutamate deformylase
MVEITRQTAVALQLPKEGVARVPLFLDSPHSGSLYPDDFNALLPPLRLRRAEDAFVNELFGAAPELGVPLIDAKFPRSYLDANRNELDFSPDDLADAWPGTLAPSEKGIKGTGLIWVRMHGLTDVYARPLMAADLQRRLETCWVPYHTLVRETYEKIHGQFGCAYHLNCHSMRSVGNVKDPDGPVARPDFVLGDRDGTSCEPGYTQAARDFLEGLGYRVQVNFPMKGAELTERYSDPSDNRHSLQIEVNRRHYLVEERIEKSDGFDAFKAHLTGLIAHLADYAASRT